jgi:NADH-quinone oxidoreductase subunit A
MSNPFVPILIMAFVAILLGVAGLIISFVLGPMFSKNKDKLINYESGIDPSFNDYEKVKFSQNFFLIAITFIIFDVELVFLYPWAIQIGTLGVIGAVLILIFTILILIPFIYEFKNKTFDI